MQYVKKIPSIRESLKNKTKETYQLKRSNLPLRTEEEKCQSEIKKKVK